jgi:hypothetical protein
MGRARFVSRLVSRVTGNMGTSGHFFGKRINQAWSVVARTRLRRAAGSVRLHSKADLP